MVLIFVCSYGNVTCAIDTIEHESQDFRILTANEELRIIFSDLFGSQKVIKLPGLFDSFSRIGTFISDFNKLPKYKHEILNICRDLNPTKIIFYYLGWNGFESWLIKQLSSNTPIYHRPKIDIDKVENCYSLRMLIKTLIASCIYGICFKSVKIYGYPMIIISKSFKKQVRAQQYLHEFDTTLVQRSIINKFPEYNDIRVLILVGGEYNLDTNLYKKTMVNVLNLLSKHYKPSEIGIKNHPNFPPEDLGNSNDYVIVQNIIPASLLCYTSELIIGYGSATLYEASNVGKTAISLINIIPSIESGKRQRTTAYLLDNCISKNILFPADLEELDCLFAERL
jgi:hypothetical protein